jgi:hypothetical protein
MDESTVMYVILPLMMVLVNILMLQSYTPYNYIALAMDFVAVIFIFMINYADFVIFPVLTLLLKIQTVPARNYTITTNQNALIKNVNGLYYATGYLTANIYNYVFSAEQVDEQEDAKLALAPDKWERIVMNTAFPFKFNLITYAKEIQSYREDLEGRRGYLEFQLSKEMESGKPNQLAIEDFQRRINIIQARIDRLSAGERPIGSVMYIETTAVGVSEKAARDSLNNQLSQLQTIFNSLDLSISRVAGRELYLLFKFGHRIPTTAQELEGLFNMQR